MPYLTIIDDDKDQGDTLRKILNGHLKKLGSNLIANWRYPFIDIEDYFRYIEAENICLLILDERLNVQANPEGKIVEYKGNELVTELRRRLKDFPIFMVTAYPDDVDVQEKSGEFEYIFSRREIDENKMISVYLPRIVRSAQRYLDLNQGELAEFNTLTNKIASGNYQIGDLDRLGSLQTKLEIPFSGFNDRQSWLDDYQKQIKELEQLKEILTRKLSEK